MDGVNFGRCLRALTSKSEVADGLLGSPTLLRAGEVSHIKPGSDFWAVPGTGIPPGTSCGLWLSLEFDSQIPANALTKFGVLWAGVHPRSAV